MHHYNYLLVLLSYTVAALGSFTALQLIGSLARARAGSERTLTIVTASVVMGLGGIWAMHFISMLACDMPGPVTYDIPLTALSAAVAVLACLVGLTLASREHHSPMTLVASGSYMGIGVAAMHYLGMYAMRLPASVGYDGGVAALSVVVAILASIAALWIAFMRRGPTQTVIGALVMGVAVSGMHYTGMSAAHFEPNDLPVPAGGLGGEYLGLVVFAAVGSLLLVVLAGVVSRQRRFAFEG
jgi:NO-binding membrane sensor protein with MHYT domain